MKNIIRFLLFRRKVLKKEFSLNEKDAAKVLNCDISSIKNHRGGKLMINLHYIKTFGHGNLYSAKALSCLLAKHSWEFEKKS